MPKSTALRTLSLSALEASHGGRLDFSDPFSVPRTDPAQLRRELDNSYFSFADSVRSGREAIEAIEDNNQLRPTASPEDQRKIDEANPVWQDQLDTARDNIGNINDRMELNFRPPWDEDDVPGADEEVEEYENLGTEEEPVYPA